jgi:uncharacterized membrane protein
MILAELTSSASDPITFALIGIVVSISTALVFYFKQTSTATEKRAAEKDAQVTLLQEKRLEDERRHAEQAFAAIDTIKQAVTLLNESRYSMSRKNSDA